MTATDLLKRPRWRLALGISCVVLPFFIYGAGVSHFAGDLATPKAVDLKAIGLAFEKKSGALFALEMGARERFLLTSTLMLAVSLMAIGYALGLIFRRRGALVAAVATLAAGIAGYAAAATSGNPLRSLTVQAPLEAAAKAKTTWGVETLGQSLDAFVAFNTFFGLAAVLALMLRFADLAIGHEDDEMSAAAIEERSNALRQTLLVASAMLTAATVATYFYYHYPLSLMTEEARGVFGALSGIASIRWGAAYSLMLITAAAPALAAFYEEQRQAKKDGALDAAPAPPAWLSGEALTKKAKTLAAVMGVLAPAMASPLLEFLKLGTG